MSTRTLLFASALLLAGIPASAAGLGGEIDTTVIGTIDGGDNMSADIWNRVRLNLLLPSTGRTSARFDVDIFRAGGASDFFIRSLYVRRRFDFAHRTLGRQPVSWAFGSIFNPVDFTLGAEIADVERADKFRDAINLYIPLAWNAGVSFTGAFTDEDIKSGARVRFGLGGYDLSANFIHEPAGTSPDFERDRSRAGAAFKGDLGPLGFYGALGATFQPGEESGISGVIGTDYSFTLRGMHPVLIQAEYLSLAPGIAGEITGGAPEERTVNTGILAGNLNFGLDDFTSIGLLAVVFTDDDGVVLAPYLETDLGEGLLLNLRGGYLRGERVALFGQTVFEEEVEPVKGIIQAVLSYHF